MFDLEKTKRDMEKVAIVDNIRLDENDRLIIIDQVKLPGVLEYKVIDDLESAYEAIKKLEVRGAPAIGIFAGYAMYVLSLKDRDLDKDTFLEHFRKNKEYLNSSRPTSFMISTCVNGDDLTV